ncbi:hypothetical protein SAMN05421544_10829 [Riemerella columbipharyngis]|uniref:Uncharacterized protein n=1 Tax=Riemerella columbipharyngis TaxID=1071918 RepID=A0A1G7CFR3_9FLAO|nr:hypothetical protein SAMN05421544_10829 [Riemerella columbipharyngis]
MVFYQKITYDIMFQILRMKSKVPSVFYFYFCKINFEFL